MSGGKSHETTTVKQRLLDQFRTTLNIHCSFAHFLIHLFSLGKIRFLSESGRMKILRKTLNKS